MITVGDVLERNFEKIYRELLAIRKVCEGARLKVILETGELKDIESIFTASLVSMYAGADFIKTSTGKVPVNATPEAVYVMCEAIKQYYARTGKKSGAESGRRSIESAKCPALSDHCQSYPGWRMADFKLFQNRDLPVTGRYYERN